MNSAIWLGAALALTACKPGTSGSPAAPSPGPDLWPPPPPTALAPPPAAPTSLASPAAVDSSFPALVLIKAGERALEGVPDHFDPAGARMGVVAGKKCHVWDLDFNVYVGDVAAKRCQAWTAAAPGKSFDGQYVAQLKNDTLTIKLTGPLTSESPRDMAAPVDGAVSPSAMPAEVAIQDERLHCKEDSELHWHPDSTQVAVRCTGQSRFVVVDRARAKVVATPTLPRMDDIYSWTWGSAGLVAIGLEANKYEDRLSPGTITAYWWPALDQAPKSEPLGAACHESSGFLLDCRTDWGSLRSKVALDPRGRLAFFSAVQEVNGQREDDRKIFDFRMGKQSPAYDRTSGAGRNKGARVSGRWMPGPHPVWETVEKATAAEKEEADGMEWRAFRLYTVPGGRTLEALPIEEKPRGRRVVGEDGKTLVATKEKRRLPAGKPCKGCDPTGRFVGIAKDTLRRVADGAELTLATDGSAHTAQGVFDGKPDSARTLLFKLGEDAISAQLVRGEQLVKLLRHPGLVDDFFAGKPVTPLPVQR